MAKAKIADMQHQTATVFALELAANGGIMEQFPTSLTARDQVGLMVKRIEYIPGLTEWDGNTPFNDAAGFLCGVTQLFNAGVAPAEGGFGDNGIVDFKQVITEQVTAIGRDRNMWPLVTELPGDGMIVHPASLYAFVRGIGAGGVMSMHVKIFFKYIDLSPEQYQEILQTIIVQNVL